MIKYISEIKNRLLLLVITCFSTFLIGYLYKETLLFLIVSYNTSLNMFYFIFTNVTEVFSVYIQLLTFFTIQIFVLYLFYHVFIFFSFALFENEYKILMLFLKVSLFIWFTSVQIANFIIIPLTWEFFLSFQSFVTGKFINLHFEAKLNEYLDFYINIYYLCIFYCQIFTILFFFLSCVDNKIKIIKKFRKLYYYLFVLFSTFVSPPDIFSQLIISLIIIGIYEVCIFGFIIDNFLVRQPIKTN